MTEAFLTCARVLDRDLPSVDLMALQNRDETDADYKSGTLASN